MEIIFICVKKNILDFKYAKGPVFCNGMVVDNVIVNKTKSLYPKRVFEQANFGVNSDEIYSK